MVLLTCRRFDGLIDDMAQVLDLFVIGSPRVRIENGDRSAEGDARRAAHRLPEAHGKSADSLTEADIRALDGLTVDQPFSIELDDPRIISEFRVIESVGAAQIRQIHHVDPEFLERGVKRFGHRIDLPQPVDIAGETARYLQCGVAAGNKNGETGTRLPQTPPLRGEYMG